MSHPSESENLQWRTAMIQADMKRIDETLANGNEQELKELHMDIDGTYQHCVDCWEKSMYSFFKDFGFNYEYLGEDSLRDNLRMMKAKLRGYLFKVSPSGSNVCLFQDVDKRIGGLKMNVGQRRLLAEYTSLKAMSQNNAVIQVSDLDYPKYKSTLDYLVQNEYIRNLNIDGGHIFLKEPAFDLFQEHFLLSIETEEEEVPVINPKRIFLVHGHDEQFLSKMELMLHRVGLEPVILKDEASGGKTIIEKIEEYTDVAYGIVLYTACDEGRKKGAEALNARARQNVVFEHGYLIAKLGRDKVVAINDDGVEVPSDLSGVVYISRSNPKWEIELAREMKKAGLKFDATRI